MFHVPCCHGRTFSFVSLFFSCFALHKIHYLCAAVAIRLSWANFSLHKYSTKRPCSHHNASPTGIIMQKRKTSFAIWNFSAAASHSGMFDSQSSLWLQMPQHRNPRRFKMHHVIMGFAALAEHNLLVGKFAVAVAQAKPDNSWQFVI